MFDVTNSYTTTMFSVEEIDVSNLDLRDIEIAFKADVISCLSEFIEIDFCKYVSFCLYTETIKFESEKPLTKSQCKKVSNAIKKAIPEAIEKQKKIYNLGEK